MNPSERPQGYQTFHQRHNYELSDKKSATPTVTKMSHFKINKELVCILSLSISFMFLFAADFTMVNMQKIVVNSIADERQGFGIDSYTVIGITYTLFAITLWFGPYINYALGSRLTMTISAVGYLCYVSSYAIEEEWAMYAGGVICGIAAGTLWPAQGHYMIENSSRQTTARNVGIFWFIFMSSNMMGNVFVYFTFHGKKYISQSTRRLSIYILMALNIIAILSFMVLPKSINTNTAKEYGPIRTIKKSWNILISRKMIWMCVTFIYAGLQQSFWNGIYSPSIGFTLAFGNSAKELVPLSGIFMSFGALLGAFCPIVISSRIRQNSYARRMIILAGGIGHLLAFSIAFINLPDRAVYGNTDEISLIQPSVVLAMLGSSLLCFGDSCLGTQIYSFIGDHYRDNSAEACALYKFVKGAMVAVCFYTCNHLGLHTQVVIMGAATIVGVTTFFVADHGNVSPSPDKNTPNNFPVNETQIK